MQRIKARSIPRMLDINQKEKVPNRSMLIKMIRKIINKRRNLKNPNPKSREACRLKQNLERLAKHGALKHLSNMILLQKSTQKMVLKATSAEIQASKVRGIGVILSIPTGIIIGTTAHQFQRVKNLVEKVSQSLMGKVKIKINLFPRVLI